MSTPCATIIQRLWNYRNVLRDEQRPSVVGEIESAVNVGLVRAARLGQAVLQSASGDASQVAPAFWADVDIVPERSEWDAVYS